MPLAASLVHSLSWAAGTSAEAKTRVLGLWGQLLARVGRQSMSARHRGREIHPGVLDGIGADVAFELLGVARDLRSGAIVAADYKQSEWACGTAYCIAGHAAIRRGVPADSTSIRIWTDDLVSSCRNDEVMRGLSNLFYLCCPHGKMPTPAEAADAIEHLVFDASSRPWSVTSPLQPTTGEKYSRERILLSGSA